MPVVLAQRTSLLVLHYMLLLISIICLLYQNAQCMRTGKAEPLCTYLLPLRAQFLYNRTVGTGGSCDVGITW